MKQIPSGSVVLAYPFPYYPFNQAMTWQSVSRMRFKEMGTYALVPGPNGQVTPGRPLYLPSECKSTLLTRNSAPGTYPSPSISNLQLLADIKTYISIYRVGAVIVDLTDPTAPGAFGPVRNVPAVLSVFTQALGQPRYIGGVALWSGLSR